MPGLMEWERVAVTKEHAPRESLIVGLSRRRPVSIGPSWSKDRVDAWVVRTVIHDRFKLIDVRQTPVAVLREAACDFVTSNPQLRLPQIMPETDG
jgi:hypothetical protein